MINKEQLFGLLFLIVGFILIIYSSNINENLEGNFYNFEFDIYPKIDEKNKINLHEFKLFYDFSKRKGNISFRLDDYTLNYLVIDFPRFINNKSVEVFLSEGKLIRDLNYTLDFHNNPVNNPLYTTLVVENINRKFESDVLTINFDMKMFPKGRFYFLHNKYIKLQSNIEGNVNFILGDDYECIFNCIYDFKSIEERWNSFDNNLKLEFLKQDEGIQDHSFKLNAISREKRFWKDFLLGIGISLLIGGITLFIQSFRKRKDC